MQNLCEEFTKNYLLKLQTSFVLLDGGMGSGKTTFCRGFMKALGIIENINSPTFNLLNEYEGLRGKLSHYDFYRIQDPNELFELGFQEKWSQTQKSFLKPHIHAVEWWQKVEVYFPALLPTFQIKITYNVDDESELRIVDIFQNVNRNRTRF